MNNITASGQEQQVGSIKSLFVKSPGLLLQYMCWLWHGSSGTRRTLVLSSTHDLQLSPLYYPAARASVPSGVPCCVRLNAGHSWTLQNDRHQGRSSVLVLKANAFPSSKVGFKQIRPNGLRLALSEVWRLVNWYQPIYSMEKKNLSKFSPLKDPCWKLPC